MSTASCLYALLFLCLGGAFTHTSAQTVLQVLRNQTQFSNFVANLNVSAEVQARLSNVSVESTVFAPVDQKTPFSLTEQELQYHIVDGLHLATNLSDGQLIPSLLTLPDLYNKPQQLKVSITNGTVSINGVIVQKPSIVASNGAINVLNGVLSLPGPLAKALEGFPTLKSLVAAANITFPPGSTVFAPTDVAFNNLKKDNPALSGYLNSGANGSLADLAKVLQYHVLHEVLYADEIKPGMVQAVTLTGQTVNITKSVVNNTSEVTLSSNSTSARVVSVDTLASDGVLHTIDSVLVPDFEFTLKKILIGLNDTTLLGLLAQANLSSLLTDPGQYTLFAPTQEAWQKADQSDYSSTTQIIDVLQSHIYPHPLAQLPNNATLVMLNNKTVHVANKSLTLEGKAQLGSALVVGNVVVGSNGYVYAINQVLGVALASDDSLSKATIGWIIVGAMGGILLLAALIVATVWYIKRKRASYEIINGV